MIEALRSSWKSSPFALRNRPALIAIAAIVACLLLFGVLFPIESSGAFRVWVESPTFNHCFVIPALSAFMVWQRRDALSGAGVAPDFRAVPAILVLSLVWLIASAADVLEAKQFVVLTMVQAALLGVLGAAYYRKLAAPFLYLYFLVPSGAYLIPSLQAFTARFAVIGLHLLAIPVFSNGAVIEIPAGTFVVAEACAGLRFLIAAVAFGVFFAVITYRSSWRRLAFIALSIVVPVIANGFRALGLIAAAQWIGNPQAALADHIIYGWLFFSFVLIVLVIIGNTFSDLPVAENSHPGTPDTAAVRLPRRIVPVAALLLGAAALGPVAASFLDSGRALSLPETPPTVAAPWHKVVMAPEWKPVLAKPTRSFSESFVSGGYQVDRFIALYDEQGPGNNLVRSSNRDASERIWSFDSAHRGTLFVRGANIPARVTIWFRGGQKRIVWSFYVVNGRPVSSVWDAKRSQLMAYLSGSRCVPAYIAVSTVIPDESTGAKIAAGLLSSSEPLRPYMCGSTGRR